MPWLKHMPRSPDQVLPLKLLPSSLGPLAAYTLRVLSINATVSQDSGPGPLALRGQGPHLASHHGNPVSEPGSHLMFKSMCSTSHWTKRGHGKPQFFWPSTQWALRTGNGTCSHYEMTYVSLPSPLPPLRPLARWAEAPSPGTDVGCFGVVA